MEAKNKKHLEEPVTVYNFAVEDYHTYFVGENEILVHNMCAVSGEANPATVTAGNKFKDHFIRHKKLLENITGNSYPKFKTHGQAFLNDISSVINNGIVKYDGIGTLKKGADAMKIYRGNGVTIVTTLENVFVTILKSGEGLDLSIWMQ